jgi:hypothetical protein
MLLTSTKPSRTGLSPDLDKNNPRTRCAAATHAGDCAYQTNTYTHLYICMNLAGRLGDPSYPPHPTAGLFQICIKIYNVSRSMRETLHIHHGHNMLYGSLVPVRICQHLQESRTGERCPHTT